MIYQVPQAEAVTNIALALAKEYKYTCFFLPNL